MIERTKTDEIYLQSIRKNAAAIVENVNAMMIATLKIRGAITWANVYLACSALEKAVNEINEETEAEIVLLSDLKD